MTAPTRKVRNLTYLRDNHQCVASSEECGGGLEWNHRESSGHGGRGRKAPALTPADGVTLCTVHNQRIEGDLRTTALWMGWKVLRNRGGVPAWKIPYFDCTNRGWWLPVVDGSRVQINPVFALELLDAAGNLGREND